MLTLVPYICSLVNISWVVQILNDECFFLQAQVTLFLARGICAAPFQNFPLDIGRWVEVVVPNIPRKCGLFSVSGLGKSTHNVLKIDK